MELNLNLFPESMVYLKKIKRIPYHHPGSESLAKAVSNAASDSDVFLLSNHGSICIGNSLDDALVKTETLEMLCKLIVISDSQEIELNYLSDDMAESFKNHLKEVK
jgi:L-fuculose-phosphate aldolase